MGKTRVVKLVETYYEPSARDRAAGYWPPLGMPAVGTAVAYELWDGEELVYIGYSMNLAQRLSEHERMGKRFNRWQATAYPTAQAARWAEHIDLEFYQAREGCLPRYNTTVYG